MTNGEKIKELFPNAEYLECEVVMDVVFARNQENWFDLKWWNAEYEEPQTFKWCTDCKEYDQEKHCCHRWSKVIRNVVEEMKQEQEPFINKPCVSSEVCEHDKNKALDKIRAEIDTYLENEGFGSEYRNDVKKIFNKYKAESEE